MKLLKFRDEYRIFRNHGFGRIKSTVRAFKNVVISKRKKH